MAEIEKGSHDDSRIVQATTSTSLVDTTDSSAETVASMEAKSSTADMNSDDPSSTAETQPMTFHPASGSLYEQNDPNGTPFQIRFLRKPQANGTQLKYAQIFVPLTTCALHGTAVNVNWSPIAQQADGSKFGQRGQWRNINSGVTACYLKITLDYEGCETTSPTRFDTYVPPTATAEVTSTLPQNCPKIEESRVTYYVTIFNQLNRQNLTVNQVTGSVVNILDPMMFCQHHVEMSVVTDLRFEDTGTEIKCHVTRAHVGCMKIMEEDATPKEDYRMNGENFEKVSDSEIPRVLKMETITNDTETEYSAGTHQMTKTTTDLRVIKKTASGGDPKDMQDLQPQRNQIIFSATSHADEHKT